MKKFLLLSLTLMLSVVLTAQENITEGVMVMKQTMSSDNEQMNAQLQAMAAANTTIYFKGDKSRNESNNPMTGDMIVIVDGTKKQMLMLMDQAAYGKKYMIQSTEPSKEDLEAVTVKKGDKTKTVLGYECQEYIVSMKQNGQDVEMQMFTTDKISAVSQNTTAMGDKVEGFPLYFNMKMNQMGTTINVEMEVVKIDQQSVPNEKFSLTPPEGYTKMEGM
ncbi:uncharacterized protein DUF4412 [Winogradskyella epiphytica]|uniref:Uncharacterized protein DUF4412 n=1 Tax=Winogradskyella epiphytica TaxID=262005 RepID=A0A2V4WV83_9FLAO|nr:DUF4412 domain-containing protein [Winogradskyella epiphytica]PYE80412.1 uncharacterized protein DUF4412 [Winogradskyella epiphytica]GGW69634.1 hypothetical protein GCM10008085_22040 [Winogradskyella epiphytica]